MLNLKKFKSRLVITLVIAFYSMTIQANQLSQHPSPYLALHAEDPVDWHVWSAETLAKAKKENKPIYLSIGYFSCHWCHVMQRESYSNKAVGRQVNKSFIAVKVDRELRPQLDRRMIAFVERLNGTAGWPLNVFLTPDGYPMTGFTYLPRKNFVSVLNQLEQQWRERGKEIADYAKQYFLSTEQSEDETTRVQLPAENFYMVANGFTSQAMRLGDELQGGFGESNKFPSSPQLSALISQIEMNQEIDPDVTKFVQLTLNSMASKNLMDHINGGFFRYTTDPDWQTPHFEKMLYDNSQLAVIYLHADRLWPNKGYKEIALRTVDFMLQAMADPVGGFYSSLSAVDIDDVEGGRYFWTQDELRELLTDEEFQFLQQNWSLPAAGTERSKEEFLAQPLKGLGAAVSKKQVNQQILNKLAGAKKPKMPIDTKKLANLNALVLNALIAAAEVDKKYMDVMTQQYHYLRDNLINGDEVVRFAGNQLLSETTLEDYAFVSFALMQYSKFTKDRQAMKISESLASKAFELYFKNDRWFTDIHQLIPGEKGFWLVQDSVLTSALTRLLDAVLQMPTIDQKIKNNAKQQLLVLTRDVMEVPYHYGSFVVLRQQQSIN